MGPVRAAARSWLLRAAMLAAVACVPAGLVSVDPEGSAAASGRPGAGFELHASSVTPKRPLLDGRRKVTLHYGYGARRPIDLEIRVLRVASGNVVRVWRERRPRAGVRLEREWNGLNRRGDAVPDGRYVFEVGPRGGRLRGAGRLRLHGHVFPVDGPHSARGEVGEFGAPRSGGRIHEGFDVNADCGTPLVAARGGTVKRAGYDGELYGYYLLIDGFEAGQNFFYSHLIAPAEAGKGERVRTGEPVGRVGQTGNARTTPCHLHFEIREGGRPIDPEPALRRWDGWS